MAEVTPLVLAMLKKIVSQLPVPDNIPTFRGVPITEFEKSDLVAICKLFANEMDRFQEKYLGAIHLIAR